MIISILIVKYKEEAKITNSAHELSRIFTNYWWLSFVLIDGNSWTVILP